MTIKEFDLANAAPPLFMGNLDAFSRSRGGDEQWTQRGIGGRTGPTDMHNIMDTSKKIYETTPYIGAQY